jgi:hypothetical protein
MNQLQKQFALLAVLLAGTLVSAQSLPGLNNMTPSVALGFSPTGVLPIAVDTARLSRPAHCPAMGVTPYALPRPYRITLLVRHVRAQGGN